MTSSARSRPHHPDPTQRSRPRRRPIVVAAAVLVGVVGIPLLLVAGCGAVVQVMEARATDRLEQAARALVAGTPYASLPADQLPGYGVSGNVLCLDNCLYLSFEVSAKYGPIVADNVASQGWTVDIPGCLTDPERDGPPCAVLDENGDHVALADYSDGPLFVMVGPG